MKRIASIAAVVGVAALVAGCSSTPAAEEGTTTIVFWDDTAGPERTATWKEIIADFEADNEDIKVEYVGIPADQATQKYEVAVSTDSTPNVGTLARGDIGSFVAQDAVVDLTDRFAASPISGELVESFVDQTKASSGDDKLWAIPFNGNQDTIWYRTDFFDAAGIDGIDTWDDFYDAAEELTADGQFGFTMRGGGGSYYQLLGDIYSQSGVTSFFDEDGVSTLDQPENIAALERFVGLFGNQTPSADVNNAVAEMQATFQSGRVAMMQHNLGSYPQLALDPGADLVNGVPLPAFEGDKRTLVSNPLASLVMFSGHEEQDEASWRFIEYVASAPAMSKLTQQIGGLPTNADVQEESWISELPHVQTALEVVNSEDTTLVLAPFYLPEFGAAIRSDIEPKFQEVLLGTLAPDAFLKDWAAQLTAAEQAYRAG